MKYLTPKICRKAQTHLWNGDIADSDTGARFCCWAIDAVIGDEASKASREFAQMLLDQGALKLVGGPLPLFNFPNEMSQGIRFMLLELTALMLEDNAL